MDTKLIAGVVVAVALILTSLFYVFSSGTATPDSLGDIFTIPTLSPSSSSSPKTVKLGKLVTTSGVERWYTNNERTFSFRLPDGFDAPDIDTGKPDVSGMTLRKDGVDLLVIYVYSVSQDTALTEWDIRQKLQGTAITKFQEMTLQSVVRGFMFHTNAPEWDGAGIEVWTVHNGRLYRIMTSEENADLLEFVISNWYFAPPIAPKPR